MKDWYVVVMAFLCMLWLVTSFMVTWYDIEKKYETQQKIAFYDGIFGYLNGTNNISVVNADGIPVF